jgi:DNA-binding MarR family transcriptional regulator
MRHTALDFLEKVSRKHSVNILLKLYESDELELGELCRQLKYYKTTVKTKVDELYNLKLVEVYYILDEERKISKKIVKLTELGRKLAEKLKGVIEVLEEVSKEVTRESKN